MKRGHAVQPPEAVEDDVTLRLYVTMGTPASSRAIVNTRRLCEEHLAGRYRLDVFNIADHIDRATADEVIASPTLVRVSPLPKRRFIGDLSDNRNVLSGLGTCAVDAGPSAEEP